MPRKTCAARMEAGHQLRSGHFHFRGITGVFRTGTFLAQAGSQSMGSMRVLSRDKAKLTIQPREENSMKVKNLLTICGVAAALLLSTGSIYAQNGNGGGNGGGGGGGGFGGGGGGRGNFDPAQMQQRMMQRYQDALGITNDTEWSAIQPLVQKVMDARRASMGNMGRMFGGRGGRGGGGGGAFGQQPDPAADALQQAVDDNAPTGQIKDLLTKYQASQKAKQAALIAAQADLRKVLTVKQEAAATLSGLLD
jgi:hypothetical protein